MTSIRWHVLLVGIDVYPRSDISLRGTVNDIDAIQRLLLERVGVPPSSILRFASPRLDTVASRPTEVETHPPTRANLEQAWSRIAREVEAGKGKGAEQRVFIYHSGHGTQLHVKSPDIDGTFAREALLPSDHAAAVVGPRQYLFDWELAAWLRAIEEHTANVTVILDACCSAGATRDGIIRGTSRFVESRRVVKLPAGRLPEALARRGGDRGVGAALARPAAPGMVVAACLDDERAVEQPDADAVTHGILTRALLEELAEVDDAELADLRWGRIWRPLVDRVAARNAAQHPWYSSGPARRVFSGPPEAGQLGYDIRPLGGTGKAASRRYQINAGSLAGVTRGALIEALPPLDGSRKSANTRKRETSLATLAVESAERARAVAVVQGKAVVALPRGARGKLLRPGEAARLRVALRPGSAKLKARIEAGGFAEVVDESRGAPEVTLTRAADKKWELCDDVYGPRADAQAPHLPAVAEGELPALVQQYFSYIAPLRLARSCSEVPRGPLALSILDGREFNRRDLAASEGQKAVLPLLDPVSGGTYRLRAGPRGALGDAYCPLLVNRSSFNLRVWLFDCGSSGRVFPLITALPLLAGKSTRAFFDNVPGQFYRVSLDRKTLHGVDRLVAIGTTEPEAELDFLRHDISFEQALAGEGLSREGPGRAVKPAWFSDCAVLHLVAPAAKKGG